MSELIFTRGVENRPYPWGAPFGQGNANTKEEAIENPVRSACLCVIALRKRVTDLAGNVAEWTEDDVDGRYLIHPGAWNVDSMALLGRKHLILSLLPPARVTLDFDCSRQLTRQF